MIFGGREREGKRQREDTGFLLHTLCDAVGFDSQRERKRESKREGERVGGWSYPLRNQIFPCHFRFDGKLLEFDREIYVIISTYLDR